LHASCKDGHIVNKTQACAAMFALVVTNRWYTSELVTQPIVFEPPQQGFYIDKEKEGAQ
jgi:hypothetical protein